MTILGGGLEVPLSSRNRKMRSTDPFRGIALHGIIDELSLSIGVESCRQTWQFLLQKSSFEVFLSVEGL